MVRDQLGQHLLGAISVSTHSVCEPAELLGELRDALAELAAGIAVERVDAFARVVRSAT